MTCSEWLGDNVIVQLPAVEESVGKGSNGFGLYKNASTTRVARLLLGWKSAANGSTEAVDDACQ